MKQNAEKIFWGVFFILGAVFIVVSKLGYLQGINALTLFLAVLFAACLVKSIISVKFTGILFSQAFLAILFAKPLGIEAITPWAVLGAALLGSIGLNLLFKGRHKPKCDTINVESTVVDEDCVKYQTTFGESIKYVNSDDFRSLGLEGSISFGGVEIFYV